MAASTFLFFTQADIRTSDARHNAEKAGRGAVATRGGLEASRGQGSQQEATNLPQKIHNVSIP